MRRFVIATLAVLFSLPPAFAAADSVQLVRVWPGYRDAASFTRLGEYFGSAPDTVNQAALRTRPGDREGFYWLIRTDSPLAHPGATLELAVVRPGAKVPERHTFTLDLPTGSHAIQAGLTGADWPDPDARPVAWQLTLTGADGATLASAQSFLWTDFAPTS